MGMGQRRGSKAQGIGEGHSSPPLTPGTTVTLRTAISFTDSNNDHNSTDDNKIDENSAEKEIKKWIQGERHLPQQVVPLHKDVDSMAQGCTVQVVCMPQRGLFQQTAPLGVLAHILVLSHTHRTDSA